MIAGFGEITLLIKALSLCVVFFSERVSLVDVKTYTKKCCNYIHKGRGMG